MTTKRLAECIRSATIDRWIDKPFFDWLFSVLAAVLLVHFECWRLVAIWEHGAFYQTLASISLGVLALGTVAVTLLVTVPQSERLRDALDRSGNGLIGVMFQCLYSLVASTMLCAVLFLLDAPAAAQIRTAAVCVATTVTVFSAVRLLWLLKRVLSLLV